MSDRTPDDGRNWRRIALLAGVAVVVVLAALAGGLWLYSEHLYRTTYESGYSYEVAVNTNESLENVTLYLPLPVEDGGANLGTEMVAAGDAAEDGFSYAVVETQYGPMLRFRADRLSVTPR